MDQTREHNKANEIDDIDQATGPQWVIPGYDAAGNMTVAPAPGPGFAETAEHRYVYDAWNRLVRVTDDQDVTLAEYEYDGLDRRIERRRYSGGQLQGTLHDYFSDRWQLLEVRVDSETDPLEQYVWGIHYIDAPLCRDRDSDDDGQFDERVYYLTDANMNVTALVDTAGAVLERYRYDAYGQVTVLEANWTPDGDGVSDYDNAVLFAGYRHDADTGLYHVRYRMYHPTLGRWTKREPLEYVDGINLYSYVRSFPTRAVDPTGREAVLLVEDWGPCDAFNHWSNGGGQSIVITGEKFLHYMRAHPVVAARLEGIAATYAPNNARDRYRNLKCGDSTTITFTYAENGTVHIPVHHRRWAAFGTIERIDFNVTCRIDKLCCGDAGSNCREKLLLSCETAIDGKDKYHNFVNNGIVTKPIIYGLSCAFRATDFLLNHTFCDHSQCPTSTMGPQEYLISWSDKVTSTYEECTKGQ